MWQKGAWGSGKSSTGKSTHAGMTLLANLKKAMDEVRALRPKGKQKASAPPEKKSKAEAPGKAVPATAVVAAAKQPRFKRLNHDYEAAVEEDDDEEVPLHVKAQMQKAKQELENTNAALARARAESEEQLRQCRSNMELQLAELQRKFHEAEARKQKEFLTPAPVPAPVQPSQPMHEVAKSKEDDEVSELRKNYFEEKVPASKPRLIPLTRSLPNSSLAGEELALDGSARGCLQT